MINLSASYQCASIEEFIRLAELAKENRQVQCVASAPIPRTAKGKGPYEKAWLEQSGNSFVRLTQGVKSFMEAQGMDLESYCKYRLEGGQPSEPSEQGELDSDAEDQRSIPAECEIDLDNVV